MSLTAGLGTSTERSMKCCGGPCFCLYWPLTQTAPTWETGTWLTREACGPPRYVMKATQGDKPQKHVSHAQSLAHLNTTLFTTALHQALQKERSQRRTARSWEPSIQMLCRGGWHAQQDKTDFWRFIGKLTSLFSWVCPWARYLTFEAQLLTGKMGAHGGPLITVESSELKGSEQVLCASHCVKNFKPCVKSCVALPERFCYYPCFINEGSEAERLHNFFESTQIVSWETGIWTPTVWFHSLSSATWSSQEAKK